MRPRQRLHEDDFAGVLVGFEFLPDVLLQLLGEAGPNRVSAVVESALYTGTGTQLSALVEGVRVKVQAGAHEGRAIGDRIVLTLPSDRIIVIPASAPPR